MSDGAGFLLAPEWARDGSYLVFRRLQQNVHRFNQHLRKECRAGARIVGRWPSGAPIVRTPDAGQAEPSPATMTSTFADEGRKSVPATLTSARLIPATSPRRPRIGCGIGCSGAAFRSARGRTRRREAPVDDGEERGLLFLAYMTSIVDQFEFVMRSWVNHDDFRRDEVGTDALLDHRKRWIVPTGGGYYFAPSQFGVARGAFDLEEAKARRGPRPRLARRHHGGGRPWHSGRHDASFSRPRRWSSQASRSAGRPRGRRRSRRSPGRCRRSTTRCSCRAPGAPMSARSCRWCRKGRSPSPTISR